VSVGPVVLAGRGSPEWSGPLTGSYPAAALLVVFSLIPYLLLSLAVLPLSRTIAASLGMSRSVMDITIASSTGAYTAGTVLAVQFAVHLRARRMLVVYEVLFVIASVLAASATTADVFIGAFIAQGLCTSLMLIAAVPPLVTSWPAEKMPVTAAIMDLCIFGAVAAGPTLGAFQQAEHAWRPLFWAVAVLSALALVFSLLTFEDDPAQDTSAPWDFIALTLTIAGSGLAFWGAGQLQSSMRANAESLVPLITGFTLLVVLVIHQYFTRRPLMPVRALASSIPVTGIYIALTASASSIGIMELVLQMLEQKTKPIEAGLYFLPEFGAALVIAVVFGSLFRSRYTPLLALAGLAAIAASAALLLTEVPAVGWTDGVVAGILGLGVGASVSPALFMAGFSLQSKSLQRVFAMIELMRGVTAFLVAPVLAFLAATLGASQVIGLRDAIWICLIIALAGLIGGAGLYLSGRPRLIAPDIERWQGEDDQPAWPSPPLLAAIRKGRK
jgi:MFS family permease